MCCCLKFFTTATILTTVFVTFILENTGSLILTSLWHFYFGKYESGSLILNLSCCCWFCALSYRTGKMSRVYVGKLSYRAREKDVERFFKGYGKILEVDLKNG